MYSSRKQPYPNPPPPPTHPGGQRKIRGVGGGVQKGRNFRGGGGWLLEVSFRGLQVRLVSYQKLTAALLSKLSVILLLNYGFQRWYFIIGRLNFFSTAYAIDSCHRLINNFWGYSCNGITQYIVVFTVMCSRSKPSFWHMHFFNWNAATEVHSVFSYRWHHLCRLRYQPPCFSVTCR